VKRLTILFVAAVLVVPLIFAVFRGEPARARTDVELAPRTDDEARIIEVYKRLNESVVFITTISLTYDLFSGLQPQEGTGSGVIIDPLRGIILTNYHVIENAKQVEVTLGSGSAHAAKLVGVDPDSDIAVLRIQQPPGGLVAPQFADSSKLEVGQRVLAIGNPFGLNRTLTTGIISSLNRSIRGSAGALMKGLIQTDAAINVGNSGGPLLDTAGRLIGINTAILSRSGDSAGIGFAVPINTVKRILPELIATGKVLRPDMGWVLVDTDQGPMVNQILAGGSADEAGVRPILRRVEGVFLSGFIRDVDNADLIFRIDGKRVYTKEEVDDLIAAHDPGQALLLELHRGGVKGKARSVEVKPMLR